MKRIVSIILSLFCGLALYAQDITSLLSLVEGNRLSLDFSYKMKGNVPLTGAGNLILDGECFRLDSGSLKVYCDSRTKWTVDEEAEEVYIEDGENALSDILGASSDYLEYVVDIEVRKDGASGTIESPQDGSLIDFSISNVKVSPKEKDLSPFVLNVKDLPESYVVTDLR